MTKRWTQRPEGSTWGDWGDDDELGRINLLTPEKVLEGVREVEAGISFCLSLPLDFPGGTILNQRRHPPVLAPTEDMDGNARRLLQRPHERDARLRRPQVRRRVGRRRRDALAAVLDPVGLARPRRRRVRRRRRRHRGGRLLQRLPRRHRPGRPDRRRRRRRRPATAASPTTSGSSTWRSTACRAAACSSISRTTSATSSRGSGSTRSEEIMAADDVVVEPGDMLLLHTGFATKILEWDRDPDPCRRSSRTCSWLDARDDALLEWIADSQISALVADNYAVEGLLGKDRHPEPPLVPADPPPLPVQARRPARRDVVPPRAGRVAPRARPQPLPAHRSPAAPARHRRLTADTGRHRLNGARPRIR